MAEGPETRMELLFSMPEEDRLQALTDEFLYGQFYAERTDDGWRRLDPLEQFETPGESACPECGSRKPPDLPYCSFRCGRMAEIHEQVQ